MIVVLDAERNPLLSSMLEAAQAIGPAVGLDARHNEAGTLVELSKLAVKCARSGEGLNVIIPGAMWWYAQAERNMKAVGARLYYVNSAPIPSMRGNTFRLCRGSHFRPVAKCIAPGELAAAVRERAGGFPRYDASTDAPALVVGQLPADKTLALSEHALDAAHYKLVRLAQACGEVLFKPHPSDDRPSTKIVPEGAVEIPREIPFSQALVVHRPQVVLSLSSMACIEAWAMGAIAEWTLEECDPEDLAASIFKYSQVKDAIDMIDTDSQARHTTSILEAWT
jgi:hypothetical protein